MPAPQSQSPVPAPGAPQASTPPSAPAPRAAAAAVAPTTPAIDWATKLKVVAQKAAEYKAASGRADTDHAASAAKLNQTVMTLDDALKAHDAALQKKGLLSSFASAADDLVQALTTLADSADVDGQLATAKDRVAKAQATGDPQLLASANAVVAVLEKKSAQRDVALKAYQTADARLAELQQQQDNRDKKSELEKKLAEAATKLSTAEQAKTKALSDADTANLVLQDLQNQLKTLPGDPKPAPA
jgi:hypothetical protein